MCQLIVAGAGRKVRRKRHGGVGSCERGVWGCNWFCRSIRGWMGDGCGWGEGIGLGLGRGSVRCKQMDVGGSLDKASLVECAKRVGQSVA